MSNKRTRAAKRYTELRKAGAPTVVTAHEAFRMTGGVIGTEGDHSTPVNLSKVALFFTPDVDDESADRSGSRVQPIDHDEVTKTTKVRFCDGSRLVVRNCDFSTS
jgi:hypothetical protein